MISQSSSQNSDTIVAIATPPGRGGVGIIRISGPKVEPLITELFGTTLTPRYAHLLPLKEQDGSILDTGLALYFPNPHSFTGEDVLEFHGHGGPIVLDMIMRRILALGVRLAKPGEFSERAFLNHKIDLSQAEAIADLINASSEQAAKAASRSLQGEFSHQIQQLLKLIIQLRMYVEAAIDFPEEEINFLSDGRVAAQLQQIITQVQKTLATAEQGSLLREGLQLVIIGKPNAGKSSLLNCLSGRDVAIVTDIPGTTRDILREAIQLDGIPLHLIDTAGLRHSEDVIEQEGIRRAHLEIEKADHILLVADATNISSANAPSLLNELSFTPPPQTAITIVRNKIDLTDENAQIIQHNNVAVINLSAKSTAGIEILKQHLKETAGYNKTSEGGFIARRRHLQALNNAEQALLQAQLQLRQNSGELVAEELRLAQQALGTITGEFTPDDLLGEIFSTFCIGK